MSEVLDRSTSCERGRKEVHVQGFIEIQDIRVLP